MAVAKSIIDVDVNDASFKKFADLFNKHREALKDLPEAWKQTGASIDEAGVGLIGLLEVMRRQNEELNKQVKAYDQANRLISTSVRSMKSLGDEAKGVARRIGDITLSLLKWGTISGALTTLAGFGGFWGFERMAHGASATRQSSLGLGISAQQLQAADAVYGNRIPGARDILGRVADVQGDLTRSWRLTAPLGAGLGLSEDQVAGKNAAELTPDVLLALRRSYLSIPKNLRTNSSYLEASGLTQFASPEQLRLLGNLDEGELEKLSPQFRKGVNQVGGSNDVNKRYQDFLSALELSTDKLNNVFKVGLVNLGGPLNHVVDAFGNLAQRIFESKGFKDGVDAFADWITHLGDVLARPETKKAMDDFVGGLEALAQGLWSFVKRFASLFGLQEGGVSTDITGAGAQKNIWYEYGVKFDLNKPTSKWSGVEAWPNGANAADRALVNQTNQRHNLPQGMLDEIWNIESTRGVNTKDSVVKGPNGSVRTYRGPFQMGDEEWSRYGHGSVYDTGAAADAAASYIDDLAKQFGGNYEMALAAYNAGPGQVNSALKQAAEKHQDWRSFLPTETQNYLQKYQEDVGMFGGFSQQQSFNAQPGNSVNIHIFNETGGNTVKVLAAMGGVGAFA